MLTTSLAIVFALALITNRVVSQSDGKFWWLQQPGGGFSPPKTTPPTENFIPQTARPALSGQEVLTSVNPAVLTEIFGTPGPSESVDDEDCVCIDFYLCQNGTITEYGATALEPRLGSECSDIQVCCKPPRSSSTTESSLTRTQDECGIRGGNSGSAVNTNWVRILDTTATRNTTFFGEFPWMLALLRIDEIDANNNMFQCGASLIHPQVALTAAHCVDKSVEKDQLKIRAGEWDMTDTNEPLPHQDRSVRTIIIHPKFDPITLFNDIALIIFDSPMELAENVATICLPNSDDNFDSVHCIATGWGRDSFGINGKYRTKLNKVDLPVVPKRDCEKKLQSTRLSRFFKLHPSFMCAGGESGKDTCQGDGGGPLICPSADDEVHYTQVGVVSWGIGCGDSDVPAVYADIIYNSNWIKQQLQDLDMK